jgi:hypothetical protein
MAAPISKRTKMQKKKKKEKKVKIRHEEAYEGMTIE